MNVKEILTRKALEWVAVGSCILMLLVPLLLTVVATAQNTETLVLMGGGFASDKVIDYLEVPKRENF
jgi:hypothetical protein